MSWLLAPPSSSEKRRRRKRRYCVVDVVLLYTSLPPLAHSRGHANNNEAFTRREKIESFLLTLFFRKKVFKTSPKWGK